MKAALLQQINEPIIVDKVPDPRVGRGEVIVKLSAAAINHRDVFIQQGLYGKIRLPAILGSDGVGTVTATGDEVPASWVGQRVVIDPTLDWGEQDEVQSKKFNILGMPQDGTFAEFIRVPVANIYKAPAHLTDEEAAAIPLAGVTAFRALFRQGHFMRGEKMLITGIGGGVALTALKLAKAVDAHVYVTSSQTEKIEAAVNEGAEGGVTYTNDDWNENLKNNAGHFDLILDGAGGDGFAKLVDVAAPAGRIVVYGGTAGKINNLSPQRIFWKQLTIKGSTMGNEEDFANMLKLVDDHQVKPVIDKVFDLNDIQAAFDRMDSGKQFGKIVVKI